jgi:DNA-directed RNA polymerase subunit K/omega
MDEYDNDYKSSDDEFSKSDSDSDDDNTFTKKPITIGEKTLISNLEDDDEVADLSDKEDLDVSDEEEDSDVESVVLKDNIGEGPEDNLSDYEDDNEESEEDDDNKEKKTVSSKNLGNPSVGFSLNEDYNEDEDDEDENDENYLQKFDRDIKKNYINEFHPECVIHNFDEVAALSHVVKDKDGIIIDDLHKTIPFLTKYERARILGQRAKQIECGAKPFVKVPENIVDSYIIAELELKQKKIPFIIRRPIPGGACEYWNLKDLEMVCF